MKRLIALCLTAACLISLVGCAGDTNMDEKKPNNTASAYALALASYPEMAPYPNEMEYFDEKTGEFDSDSFDVVYDAWKEDRNAQRNQPEGYADGLEPFFASSIREFLSNSNGANKVYSPINVYMALAMLAEVTDGESRQQILTLLGSENIEALRSQAASVWNANYSNDGAVTSILANSLWLNESVNFNQATMDSLAKNYYASSFRGEMGSEDFIRLCGTGSTSKPEDCWKHRLMACPWTPRPLWLWPLPSTTVPSGTVSSTRAERKRACSTCSALTEKPWSATSCTRAAATPITGQISLVLFL